MWQRHDMSWHFVTFHGMLWHLHETTGHDMMVMSRRLMPAQGSEPETHTALVCPNSSRIQSDTYLGSNLTHFLDPVWFISWIQSSSYLGSNPIHILDPVWYISWIQSDTYLGSNLIHILDPIWYISWIWSDISCFESSPIHILDPVWYSLDPIWHTSHSSLSYSTISTHTHTHSRRRLSMIIRCRRMTSYCCGTSSSSSGKLKSVEGPWEEYPPSYQQIFQTHNSCQCYIFRGGTCTRAWWLHHGRIVIILWPDHPPPFELGSNVNWLDHHWCCCCCCKAPCLKSWIFDLHLQIFLWFQFGIVGAIFQTVVTSRMYLMRK